jgi:REP-associated tyrosine transposase
MKRWRQQEFTFRTRGGKRRGAGRKSARLRRAVPHSARPEHKKGHPVHVTLRASRRLPSLRREVVFLEIRRALGRTARSWFRLVHFSVQSDHLHLLVEAADKSSLSRGLMGLSIRVARAVNRALERTGRVWDDRFHARALTSPREVRHAVVYVLMNAKKHIPAAPSLDPCSSARSFTDWKTPPALAPPSNCLAPVTQAPETWLLRAGWKKHGLIAPSERPRKQL